MKKNVVVFISLFAYFNSVAQSEMIKDVFRLLPADKIYNLTVATRDSMLAGKTYYPANNDNNEIIAYNYGSSEYVKDYLYISLSFETEQRATGMIEIRSFKMLNGDDLILVSQTGGVWQVNHSQQDFSVFIYDRNRKLIPYAKKILPASDDKIFIKQGIPDTLKKTILNNSNLCFNLSNENMTMSLNSRYISDDESLRKWLKGDIVYFDWIKDRFVAIKMEFE
jgi:hypothetical protein